MQQQVKDINLILLKKLCSTKINKKLSFIYSLILQIINSLYKTIKKK